MSIQKHFPSGGWIISEIIDGYLVTKIIMGHTKKEAIAIFNQLNKKDKTK